MNDEWKIEQHLVRLQLLSKSMTGEETVREVVNTLSVEYGISSERLFAAMRDRASANTVAMRTVKILYPNMLDVGCFAHTLDHVGDHFKTPNLYEFCRLWISLFSHSFRTRIQWKEQTGRAMSLYSATRWWSRWEVLRQVFLQFGDIHPFSMLILNYRQQLEKSCRRYCLIHKSYLTLR